jgi:hypothetical protein
VILQGKAMKMRTRKTLVIAGFAAAIVVSGGAQAATYTFNDPGWVSGSIDTSTGDISLNALFANPGDVADTISGLILTFATAPGATSLTGQASADGLLDTFNIGPGPTHTRTLTQASGASVNWTLSALSTVLTLSANHSCAVGGGSPCDLIVGPTPYTAFNSSIETHSPFLDLEGLFQISGLGGELLTGLVVQFGTGPTDRTETLISCGGAEGCAPPPAQTPLPAALPLFATGLGGLGLLGWRRKRKAQAVA